MITIKDIAKKAGVSTSTVSRALNNHQDISKETKEKILKVLKDNNYTPNALARSLIQKKTYTIGLLLPEFTGNFYPNIAQVIEDVLSKYGYYTIYGITNGSKTKEKQLLNYMLEGKLDGIVVTPEFMGHGLLRLIQNKNVPVIFLRRRPPKELDVPFVDVHYYDGAYKAIEYLVSLEHKEIGFIGMPENSIAGKERYKGYSDAIENNNLDKIYVIAKDKSIESGRSAMEKLFTQNPSITAVFAAHDYLAVGALEWLEMKGVSVPENMSIIGFGNLEIANLYWTNLTTVAQPLREMGAEVANILLNKLGEKEYTVTNSLKQTKLVIRNSCQSRSKQTDLKNKKL